MRRVVITGIGVVSPLGIGARAFWEALLAGTSAIGHIKAFDAASFPSRIAGEVPAYRIADYVPKSYRKATKVMARDIELAVVAADDAFRDARLESKAYSESPTIPAERFGCNIGAGLISAELNELTAALQNARRDNDLDLQLWGTAGMSQLTPLWLLKYLPNMLACHVTIIHGLKGPSNTITCADASSHLAIGEAFRTIQRGSADLAICGGAESKVNPMGLTRPTLLKRLTETSADPAKAVRPFDAAASGTAIAEGGGLLLIEEYERARARGAHIHAEIIGFGASQDTYSVVEPDPSGYSYSRCITRSLADAGITAGDVGLLVPNGLGIAAFDRAELAGLKLAFGNALPGVHISLPKAQIGNLAAGSGVDAIAAALAVSHGKTPPAINTTSPIDPALNVSPESRSEPHQIAMSTTYSLGGQNASLVFKRV